MSRIAHAPLYLLFPILKLAEFAQACAIAYWGIIIILAVGISCAPLWLATQNALPPWAAIIWSGSAMGAVCILSLPFWNRYLDRHSKAADRPEPARAYEDTFAHLLYLLCIMGFACSAAMVGAVFT